MEDLELHLDLANRLEAYGCTQLSNGLREGTGIGQQVQLLGSLNGCHSDNPYMQAIEVLTNEGFQGAEFHDVRRRVDAVLVDLGIDQGERDLLAHLLTEGLV